ncbi:MAG: ATP-binding cassette domain-containing protein [Burkholderiales bacterium]|nr:ATP-binding cassette domain-containing protein [Burkholderiales bacterium]
MIRLQSMSLARGVKPLFDRADLVINAGEHVGLIGANGSGKTTLFALLLGRLHADAGAVELPPRWRVAHVAQETPALERAALDYVIDGDAALRALEAELAALEAGDAAHDDHARGNRIAELHALLDDAGAYTVRPRAEQLLTGLGFAPAQMAEPVASFSGGWRMRLNLAQALICPSDLLLLDEPTNHLDLDAILWLEDWLRRYPGTLIIISHDRDFLDGAVGVIAHIDQQKIRRYGGNYSQFEVTRAMALTLGQAAYEKQQRERAHLQSFIDRFKAKATKAKQAQSRMKMLAKMEELAPVHAASPFAFEFREPLASPNPLLVIEDGVAGYTLDDGARKPVVSGIRFTLASGQRIGLLGVNGAGKSTLIKTIAGELPLIDGVARFGKGLVIGYFAQHQLEMLRHDESPLWHMARLAPNVREQELRNFLGGFNFPGEMVTAPVAPFSGGEKARLALALIAWQRPNLLLLDEPTNHLDLETREALTVALAQFEGTLVLVSHDRHLLRATTEEFAIVSSGRLQPFDGDLEDYREWLFATRLGKQDARLPAPAAAPAAPAPQSAAARQEQKRAEAEARQRRAARLKPVEARIKRLEEQMAKLQARKAEIDGRLAGPEIYEDARKEELKSLMIDQAYVARELDALESEWLEKQAELEALQAA